MSGNLSGQLLSALLASSQLASEKICGPDISSHVPGFSSVLQQTL
jgi:hypothetical protein